MTTEGMQPLKASIPAGADLSAAANQYKAVKQDANGDIVLCSAITDRAIGILQNTPALGIPGEVMIIGESKYQADAAIAIGALLGVSADGQFVTVAAGAPTQHWVGRSRTAPGAAGVLGTGWFNFVVPMPALTAN